MTNDEVVVLVIATLESLNIDYLLVGALASNAWGIPRTTVDADVVVVTGSAGILALAERLGTDFRLERQISFEMITHSKRNVLWYVPNLYEIELFRFTNDPHHQQRLARRVYQSVPGLGRAMWLPTPEDVVIQKLRWGRDKDLDDISNVLAVSAKLLDWDYLRHWTTIHGTWELLEQRQAKLPDLSVLDDLPD